MLRSRLARRFAEPHMAEPIPASFSERLFHAYPDISGRAIADAVARASLVPAGSTEPVDPAFAEMAARQALDAARARAVSATNRLGLPSPRAELNPASCSTSTSGDPHRD